MITGGGMLDRCDLGKYTVVAVTGCVEIGVDW
jgi:hypothetical protein